MTIEELKRKLDAIPPASVINKARRARIVEMINRLAQGLPAEG